MRIVFIGSVKLSAEILLTLIGQGENIVGICQLSLASRNSDYYDLSSIKEAKKIPTLKTLDINAKESVNWIKELKPDIVLCIGWS